MKRNVLRLLLISCLLFLFGDAYSQEWIPLGGNARGKAVTMKVLQDDASCYIVNVRLNGLYDNKLINEHGSFHYLSLGEIGKLMTEGEPTLPLITQLIAIPPGTVASVSIENEVWTGINIGTIWPAQRPTPDDGSTTSFIINDSIYSNSFLPAITYIGKEMNWRNIRNVGVQVCPFKYYPQDGTLSVMKEFVLRVDFIERNGCQGANTLLHKEPTRFGLFANTVYTEESSMRTTVTDNYDYLIIVADNTIRNSQKMKEFQLWKAFMGLKTKTVRLDSIGFDYTDIKNYITSEYANSASRLKYVLLVGDNVQIDTPTFTNLFDASKTYVSDYWYGCVTGNDAQQEIPIGRFSVDSLCQFSNMVDKTIRYETWKNLDYKALLVGHNDHNSYYYTFLPCCDTIINRTYSESLPFITAYGSQASSTNAYVTGLINQGTHIVNYRGHGSPISWGNPKWNVSNESYDTCNINNINQNTNAVFFSVACNTGNIASNKCMLEVFTRPPKGAVAFVGSSTSSDHYVNDEYNKLLYRNLLDSTVYRLGDMNMHSFINLLQQQNHTSYTEQNAYSYICGGDPSLELWTSEPQAIPDVDINSSNGNLSVVTSISGYDINISSTQGELINSIHVSGNSASFTKPDEGEFYISIRKHNYIPYIVYCNSITNYLQSIDINYNGFYDQSPFAIGEAVNDDITSGDVTLKSGSKLTINLGSGGVLLDDGFKVEKGASLVIK